MKEMRISRKKTKITIVVATLFFVSLIVGPFLPVWAENNTRIDAPGDEWNGEIAEPQNDGGSDNGGAAQGNGGVQGGDNGTQGGDAAQSAQGATEPASRADTGDSGASAPEMAVEKVVVSTTAPVIRRTTTPVVATTTTQEVEETPAPAQAETPENNEADVMVTASGIRMEVVEVLETSDGSEDSKSDILVPETAGSNVSKNKVIDRAKRISLMALSASGIIFFTGVMVWAAWKFKNLPKIQNI